MLEKLGQKVLFLIAGYLAARASVLGELTPFAVSLTAASPSGYIMYSFAGALVGHAFTGGLPLLKSTAALIAVAGIRWALSDLSKITRHWAFVPLNAFASVFIVSMIIESSASTVLPEDILLAFAEGILALGGAVFFSLSCRFIAKKSSFASVTAVDMLCLALSFAVLLLPIIPLSIFSVSIGRIAMLLILLSASRIMHELGGAICGAAFGMVLAISNPEISFIASAYTFSGIVAGMIMRKYNSIIGSVAFAVCSLVITASSGSSEILPLSIETIAACTVFSIIPTKVLDNISSPSESSAIVPAPDSFRRAVLGRLERASHALADISSVIGEVSKKLDKLSARDISEVFNISAEEICVECGLRACCWQTCLSETKSAFGEMAGVLAANGRIMLEELPEHLTKKCAHPNELMQCINRNYSDFTAREGADRRIAEMREVVNDQYSGMSELLKDIAQELSEFKREDSASAEKIKNALNVEGYTPLEVNCRLDNQNRMSVDLRALCFGLDTETTFLDELISEACSREFEPSLIERCGDEFRLHTTERAVFSVALGAAQHSCNNGRLCGDAYEFYRDGKGRVMMILSDGMGTGGHAAIDSCMASSLMSRLLKGGFDCNCALKIVNCALLVKSNEESLATLDIACLDLFSGKAEIFKAGAPLTLIRKGNRIVKVDSASLPAGILREVAFEQSCAALDDGDLVLMISDGALVESTKWIEQRLLEFSNDAPQEFCDKIISEVSMRRSGDHDDDVTVLLAKIERDDKKEVVERSA